MRRYWAVIIAALLLQPAIGAPAAACSYAPQPPLPTAPLKIETARGVYAFAVELAVTQDQRACGLMHRPRLARDAGMLFKQDPPGPAFFWMKNTPQPLDMLFIGQDGRILHIARHTTPYSTQSYGTEKTVAAVLELAAGMTTRIAAAPGDRVRHAWFE